MFVGQGGTLRVGSDRYGFYVVGSKTLSNGKKVWGISRAKTCYRDDYGNMTCVGPASWNADKWIIASGKWPKTGRSKWWECDENGRRAVPGKKCLISWTGAITYLDPSL